MSQKGPEVGMGMLDFVEDIDPKSSPIIEECCCKRGMRGGEGAPQ